MEAHRQLLRDSNREVQILQALLSNTKDDTAIREFTNTYVALVQIVLDTRLDESAKKMKAQAAYLTGLAGVAAFLASVQIGFFSIIGTPDCSIVPQPDGCGNHAIFLRALTNFFSYLALSFDALGALFAIFTARSLLRVSDDAQDLMDDKFNLDGLIIGQLDRPDSQLFKTLTSKLGRLYVDVGRQQHIVKDHTGGTTGVLWFIMLGMLCFFVALISQVIETQPLKFWAPFVALVAAMAFIVTGNEKRNRTGLWSNMTAWMNGRKRSTDIEKMGDEEETRGTPLVSHDVPVTGLHEANKTNTMGPKMKSRDTDHTSGGVFGVHNTARDPPNNISMVIGNGATLNFTGDNNVIHVHSGFNSGKMEDAELSTAGYYGGGIKGENSTALQAAVEAGNAELVERLLEEGAEVNSQGGGHGTALQTAAHAGHTEIVKLLIDRGADVNSQGGEHGTALQAAIRAGQTEAVSVLIESGANVNSQGDNYGTALHATAGPGPSETNKLD